MSLSIGDRGAVLPPTLHSPKRAAPDPRPVEPSHPATGCEDACGTHTVLGALPGSIPFHTLLERSNARARSVEQGEQAGTAERNTPSAEGAAAQGATPGDQRTPLPDETPELRLGWPAIGDAPAPERAKPVREIERVYRVRLGLRRGATIDLIA